MGMAFKTRGRGVRLLWIFQSSCVLCPASCYRYQSMFLPSASAEQQLNSQ